LAGLTPDQGGTASTIEFAQAVLKKIRRVALLKTGAQYLENQRWIARLERRYHNKTNRLSRRLEQ
jgi:hypothetical protein